jgi:hypothetical protein
MLGRWVVVAVMMLVLMQVMMMVLPPPSGGDLSVFLLSLACTNLHWSRAHWPHLKSRQGSVLLAFLVSPAAWVAPDRGVPKDAGKTALARAPREITANLAFLELVIVAASGLPFFAFRLLVYAGSRACAAWTGGKGETHLEVDAVCPVSQLSGPIPAWRGLRGDDGVITVEL